MAQTPGTCQPRFLQTALARGKHTIRRQAEDDHCQDKLGNADANEGRGVDWDVLPPRKAGSRVLLGLLHLFALSISESRGR
jgi:hypothetical protein